MRFAWIRKHAEQPAAVKPEHSILVTLTRVVYNLVFWVFLLPFFTPIAYSTGFIAFAIVILVRLSANLYINNFLSLAQYDTFPLRS
ncbi:MAG: hypothetical protein ACK2UW_25680 [Anaerolineales bacterium]